MVSVLLKVERTICAFVTLSQGWYDVRLLKDFSELNQKVKL